MDRGLTAYTPVVPGTPCGVPVLPLTSGLPGCRHSSGTTVRGPEVFGVGWGVSPACLPGSSLPPFAAQFARRRLRKDVL